MHGADSGQARVGAWLARAFVVDCALLLGLGAAFVFPLRPDVPYPAALTLERGLEIVGPFCALVLAFAWSARGLIGRIQRSPPAPSSRLQPALAGAATLACCAYALWVRDAHVSVLFLLAGPALVTLAWTRATGRLEPLLAGFPLLGLGLVLFGLELGSGHSGEPPVRWGGPETFATLFPREEPFLGEGGRLRPNLDLYMASAERLRGATVRTNSQGFRNAEEFGPIPEPGELRVLSLGDSFSIGMQIDQEDFLGPRLEAELARDPGGPVRVLNAEVSDPAYGLHYLQRHGLAYRPQVVLYGLCANDTLQAASRFGPGQLFELGASDALIAHPEAPSPAGVAAHRELVYPTASPNALASAAPSFWQRGVGAVVTRLRWNARKLAGRLLRFRALRPFDRDITRTTPVPMFSYASAQERIDGHMRLLDGTANLAYFYLAAPPVIDAMYEKLFALLRAMDRSVRRAGGDFVLVVHPQRFQVEPADWQAIRDYWGLDESDFDLERYNRRLADFCRESGLLCLDLLEAFRSKAAGRSLYLPRGDMHYNRAGHAVAAKALADFLRANGQAPASRPPAPSRAARLTRPEHVGYVR